MALQHNQPIGLFDSGMGGLTVLHELERTLPNESYIYIADTKRAPYGNKSTDDLWKINEELINLLLKKDIKLLVLACNTSCALFLNKLKRTLSIPVIGLIPSAATYAVQQSKYRSIAVMGTQQTINSNAYKNVILSKDPTINVHQIACPALVPIIENNRIYDAQSQEMIRDSLNKTIAYKPDIIIHGCSHFPFLEDLWIPHLPSYTTFVNPAKTICADIPKHLLCTRPSTGHTTLIITGEDHTIRKHYFSKRKKIVLVSSTSQQFPLSHRHCR